MPTKASAQVMLSCSPQELQRSGSCRGPATGCLSEGQLPPQTERDQPIALITVPWNLVPARVQPDP